jgi:hypothetical protein
MRKFLLAIVTLSFLLSGELSQAKPRSPIKIVDGKVEITQYNKQIFRLEGEWRFSDKNLKTIDEKQFSTLPLKSAYLKSPYWEFYSPGPARGAFVLRIDTDAAYSLMALTYAITARSQLLLVNEEGIRESYVDPFFGQASLEQTRRELSLPTFHLELAKGTNFLIYNYEQKTILMNGVESISAGFSNYFDIGLQQELHGEILYEKVTLLIPTGIILCLAIYSLLIYLSRRGKDQESLLLFGFNICTFAKEIGTQSILGLFMQSNTFSQLFHSLWSSYLSFTLYFGVSVVYLTVKSRFLRYLQITTLGTATASCLVHSILALGTNIPDISAFSNIHIILEFTLQVFVFTPYLIVQAIRRKRNDLILLSLGYLALAAGSLFDFYKFTFAVDFPWMSMWGGTILSVIYAKNNSKMFALTYERSEQINSELQIKNAEIKDLNANLENKVLERTAEINSLLQHIPQGVLTIGEDACLGMNYSAHLPILIGQSEIGGRSFKEVILDNSELSHNQVDQA